MIDKKTHFLYIIEYSDHYKIKDTKLSKKNFG